MVKLSQLLMAMSQVCDLSEVKDMGHAQRVTALALDLADRLQTLDPGQRAELAVAALLHDIGLSSVTYHLFERLRGDERDLLHQHPCHPPLNDEGLRFTLARHTTIGARLLHTIGYGPDVTETVAHMHELDVDHPVATQILRVADILETETFLLDTVQARMDRARERVTSDDPALGTLDPALRDAIGTLIGDREIWEAMMFLDHIEERLDACFDHTYGVHISFGGLEAHLRLMAQVIDAQSPYLTGHTLEVTRLVKRMGERIGLEPDALQRLTLASLIHAAGRLAVPSALLEKRGGLSDAEFVTLHTYPNRTREALAPLVPLRDLIDEASAHREKLDGSGYPEARLGDSIPLIGRIIGVADTFVALVSDRPYRVGYSHSRALAIIQSESARLFDGLVTDALEHVYRDGF